jgi:hypothetical protein
MMNEAKMPPAAANWRHKEARTLGGNNPSSDNSGKPQSAQRTQRKKERLLGRRLTQCPLEMAARIVVNDFLP